MPTDSLLALAVDSLHRNGCSCALITADGHEQLYHERGVKDLFNLLINSPEILHESFIADKVVGKGAAALMCAGQVAEVFADVISDAALQLFKAHHIKFSYGMKVSQIINRQQTGICPVERLCMPLGDDVERCVDAIKDFLSEHQ